MKPLGSQCIVEFIDCTSELLDDRNGLEEMLAVAIKESGLTLVNITGKKFEPVGVTVVAVIGESHVVIHTYPEARHASIDVFTCSNGSGARDDLLNYLRERLRPRTERILDLVRGNPLEVTETGWLTSFSSVGYEARYHIAKRVFSKRSRYQQIDIIDNENFGRMMFLDRDLQVAERDVHLYNAALVDPIIDAGVPLDRVAILGGGDGGVLSRLLEHDPTSVTLVDIDEAVIAAAKACMPAVSKGAFDDPRVNLVIDDANSFLRKERRFDAIIYDLTMHPEALTNTEREAFLDEIFSGMRSSLMRHGVLSMQCGAQFDVETLELLRGILPRYFEETAFDEVFIPSFCEMWMFGCARVRAARSNERTPTGRSRRAKVTLS